jgi:hypothetical protein
MPAIIQKIRKEYQRVCGGYFDNEIAAEMIAQNIIDQVVLFRLMIIFYVYLKGLLLVLYTPVPGRMEVP